MKKGDARRQAILEEKQQRQRLREERQRLMSIIVPLAVAGAGLWVMLLTFGNAHDRRGEIGMLRAIGMRERQIIILFVAKSLLMGSVGGLIGVIGGVLAGALAAEISPMDTEAWHLSGGVALAMMFLIGPLLGCLAGLPPAISAARRDPAEVLCKE
ncbi:MAG: ABC transporter permease [Opitutae bacterium]|nr:ABC transporter permease [Opitutae bacterium]